MGKYNEIRNDQAPTAAELAALWMMAQGDDTDAEEADLLFEAAIRSEIDADQLDREGLSAILDHLPSDEHYAFLQACEEMSAQEYGRFSGARGEDAFLQIFAIPVHGAIPDVEAAIKDPAVLDGIAQSLRMTGYVAKESNVLVFPELFPVQTLALMGPAWLHNLLLDGAEILGRKRGTNATVRLLSDARDLLANKDAVGEDEILFAVRFLIGVRISMDEGDLADGLAPDLEETDQMFFDRLEQWRDRSDELLAGHGAVTFEPPVPWGEARVALLTCALRQLADLALEAEGLDLTRIPYPDLTARVAFLPDALEVELIRSGRLLMATAISQELIGPALDDLLEAIDEEFPLEEEDAARPKVMVH